MKRDDLPNSMEVRHLGREVKTALELAILALCPEDLVERLASSAGMLDAVAALPADTLPLAAMLPGLMSRAKQALADWTAWKEKRTGAA